MRESTRSALIVLTRIVLVALAIAIVILVRTTVGWGSVLLMLAALGVLLGVLASYNRRFR